MFNIKPELRTRVADPDGAYPDPDPSLEKKTTANRGSHPFSAYLYAEQYHLIELPCLFITLGNTNLMIILVLEGSWIFELGLKPDPSSVISRIRIQAFSNFKYGTLRSGSATILRRVVSAHG